ncbi:hypothetical protein [Microbacterium sp. cx-59]|uniref:hypothetical protein n=1 Tax=Microbacterium sp. cx-59 TaxID=2891207 RepID=UPI001E3BFBCA|nr:hypothetical protein [Microbacterium sp. cx-59]MCC4908951.1 hypothetical protein [Microbacterium sp. cx-59]
MTDDTSKTIQSEIARTFIAAIEGEWERGVISYVEVGGTGTAENWVSRSGGSTERIRLLNSTLDAFSNLREIMYQPTRGAWFSARVEVAPSGGFEFTFNYDNRVFIPLDDDGDFLEPVAPQDDLLKDDSYVRDLEQFPRDEQFIPEWYPRENAPAPIADPVDYFADALNRTVTPLRLEKRLADASPVWASMISEIHAAVPQQIATLTDEFSAELVDPGLSWAKAIWILNGPLQTITGEPVDRHMWQKSLPNLLDLYRAVKTLPTDARDGLVLELETFPDYTTVPATAPDTTVRMLWDTNTFGKTEHTELLSILTQVVNETASAVATNDALNRFDVTVPPPGVVGDSRGW